MPGKLSWFSTQSFLSAMNPAASDLCHLDLKLKRHFKMLLRSFECGTRQKLDKCTMPKRLGSTRIPMIHSDYRGQSLVFVICCIPLANAALRETWSCSASSIAMPSVNVSNLPKHFCHVGFGHLHHPTNVDVNNPAVERSTRFHPVALGSTQCWRELVDEQPTVGGGGLLPIPRGMAH
jgi:hypothetical protein